MGVCRAIYYNSLEEIIETIHGLTVWSCYSWWFVSSWHGALISEFIIFRVHYFQSSLFCMGQCPEWYQLIHKVSQTNFFLNMRIGIILKTLGQHIKPEQIFVNGYTCKSSYRTFFLFLFFEVYLPRLIFCIHSLISDVYIWVMISCFQ